MHKSLLICVGSLFLFQLTPAPGEAQPPSPEESKELVALRDRYQADVQFALKPVQSHYLVQLQGLVKTLTQKGDLAGALVVMEELKKQDPQTATTATPTALGASLGNPKPPQRPTGVFSGFAKLLKDVVEIVPWAAEMDKVKFKPHDKAVPDELRVTINGPQIEIDGVKKHDTSRIEGNLIAHWGKLVLISAPPPQSGTFLSRVPFVDDGTRYGIALEMSDGTIKSSLKPVKLDTGCDWSVRIDGGALNFEITEGGVQQNSLGAKVSDVKAFGFISIVRYHGNKSDLVVTVNPSSTLK